MNQEFHRWLFMENGANGAALTLGEAALLAKAAVGHADLRLTWLLFGDPSMVLNMR
jgi:hypothetical protein